MEIDVSKLCASGKCEGEVRFSYNPPEDCCLIPLCGIEGAVNVNCDYFICDDGKVEVRMTVDYLLSGQCSYCLKDARRHITYTADLLYDVRGHGGGEEDDRYYYDGRKINLKTAVDDTILISQPNVLLCKDGCEGIDVTNK